MNPATTATLSAAACATVQPAPSAMRLFRFVVAVAIVGGLVGACCGQQAGLFYGYSCTVGRNWDPSVRAFLLQWGVKLGAYFGVVVAWGYCRRMVQIVREAGFAMTRAELDRVGTRLGVFFGVIATLLLHGGLWVIAAFVAPRKPELVTLELVVFGLGFSMIAGAIAGWMGARLCKRILGVEILRNEAAHYQPQALRIGCRRALLIGLAIAALAGTAGWSFGAMASMGYRTMYQAHAWGFAINNSPAFIATHGGHDLVEAISQRPFVDPLGRAAGLGSGLIVAGLWSWMVLASNRRARRGVDAVVAIVLGVVACLASTAILHWALAETVHLDTARLGPIGSMFGSGLCFGISAGAGVGMIGAVMLTLATRRHTEPDTELAGGVADESVVKTAGSEHGQPA